MPTSLNSNSKILIVGTSGAGKSTLAARLSSILNLKDIELDSLFWQANWTETELPIFKQRIENAMESSPGWVIHGNYGKVRDLTWGKASIVLWLDYSRAVIFWRVFKRSVFRILKAEVLWAGNKESFRKTFLSKKSIILWSVQTYGLRKQQYEELISSSDYSRLKIFRFKNPNEAEKFISELQIEKISTIP